MTSEVAFDLHKMLSACDVKMVVPHLYLEEMAAHLINAGKYTQLAGEAELARSENYFVAHYHAAAGGSATAAGFETFLEDLGLPARRDDFGRARATVERTLIRLLGLYGMSSARVTRLEALALQDEPERDRRVIEHDRRVVGWLDDRTRDFPTEGLVLCTQDWWLLSAVLDSEWLRVDAAALADPLPMIRPARTVTPLSSLREIAARMDEAALERSARVWDLLAEIEGPRLVDRDLLRRAHEFKDAWLARERTAERPARAEWLRFKERLSLDG